MIERVEADVAGAALWKGSPTMTPPTCSAGMFGVNVQSLTVTTAPVG